MDSRKNRKGTIIAIAAWVLGALILVLLFVVNKDRIVGVLYETRFFQQVFGTEPRFIAEHSPAQTPTDTSPPLLAEAPPPPPPAAAENTEEASPAPEAEETAETPPPDETDAQTIDAKLFFVSVDSDGTVLRREVTRAVEKSESPLTAALTALLQGPTEQEAAEGLMTLVPEGSRLISAVVKDSVATLNFNENFEYNRFSAQGYLGQLTQVVLTATSFPTVESVQILIEGERKNYLGSEGVWIGTPLTAASLARLN